MEVYETEGLLPLGQVELTDEELKELLALGVNLIDEDEEEEDTQ